MSCSKFRGCVNTEPEIKLKAFNYLFQYAQRNAHSNVLEYPNGSTREPCPLLVQQLNLYIDDHNIIWYKCIFLRNDTINPVILKRITILRY